MIYCIILIIPIEEPPLLKQINSTTISAKELFEQGKKSSISIIIIKTIGSFAKEFLFKFAFLDGFYGIVVGGINTFSVFLKYSKLKALIDKSGK